MESTKERINKLREQEALMDYTADLKLAIYYGLVHKEDYTGELTIIDNDYHLSVKYDGKEYKPYKYGEDQGFVFAHKEGVFGEQDDASNGQTTILTLPEDFEAQLEDLKTQDEQLNQKHKKLYTIGQPTNKTKLFLLVMAWISISVGTLLFLENLSYNPSGAFLILIGSLASAAILFALAEIIKLLEKK